MGFGLKQYKEILRMPARFRVVNTQKLNSQRSNY